jgi:hypothetical protein
VEVVMRKLALVVAAAAGTAVAILRRRKAQERTDIWREATSDSAR